MSVTLISTPAHEDTTISPSVFFRWLATECPNLFRLLRKDFLVNSCNDSGGYLQLVLPTNFIGNVGDSITVYDDYTDSTSTGTVTAIASPATTITTDITWVATFDVTYFNDNTLYPSYYFEGKLTINGIVQSITVIASPDSKGYADLDVSGILRTKTATGKIGVYTSTITAETSKSGKFTFAYRGMYAGADSSTSYTSEGNTWYYVESIRSQEQGCNLYEFVPSDIEEQPFFNMFEEPVYFKGLPFDISFINPLLYEGSPSSNLSVTRKHYNAVNTLLSTHNEVIDPSLLQERLCSLYIDPATIEASASYMTVEIDIA
jgi:hypothetical protein